MRLARSAANLMSLIWRKSPQRPFGLPTDWIFRLRDHPLSKRILTSWSRAIAPALSAIGVVYIGAAVLSHALFNVQDVAGWTCRDHTSDANLPPARRLEVAKESEVEKHVVITFSTSDFCKATGVLMQGGGARYYVKVEPTAPWRDWTVPVPAGGFSPKEPPPWYWRALLSAGTPLRREFFEDWFRIVLRYGRIGGEEAFLDPDPTDPVIQANVKPTREGELFVFVNDAVLGIPGLYNLFYRNNQGTAVLTIRRTR